MEKSRFDPNSSINYWAQSLFGTGKAKADISLTEHFNKIVFNLALCAALLYLVVLAGAYFFEDGLRLLIDWRCQP